MYAIDRLFGLPRKKADGVSYRETLQGDIYFCDQEGVDEFVEELSNAKSIPTVRLLHYVMVGTTV